MPQTQTKSTGRKSDLLPVLYDARKFGVVEHRRKPRDIKVVWGYAVAVWVLGIVVSYAVS